MADSKAPLTAAERRERRLNRILGDGENRIKKILSGPDGDEQRLPPMLEGGEYNFPLLSNSEEKQEEEEAESTPSTSTLSSNRPSTTNQLLSKIRQMDIPLSLLYGLFIRLVMVRWSPFNVFLPWFLLFFGSRFLSFVQDGSCFLSDVKAALNSRNLSAMESLLKRSCSAFTFLHVFMSRLVVMVAAFLITHSIVIMTYGTY